MSFIIKTICFLALVVSSLQALYAQQVEDTEYYLDDGGLSNRKNIIKLNVASILTGDLAFFYERALSKSMSLELGAGILLPYYQKEWPSTLVNPVEVDSPEGGYSLWFHPKYYVSREIFEYAFYGLQFRQRNYKTASVPTLTYTDVNVIYGYQLLLGDRFTIGANFGLGFRFKTESLSNKKNELYGLSMPFAVKTGIIF